MKRTILLMSIVAWLLVPTGTPDDVITWYLITQIGLKMYGVLIMILFYLMWRNKVDLKKFKIQ